LGGSPNAAKSEFSKQGTLVDLFEESSAKDIGDLKDCGERTLSQRVEASVFICG